MKKALVPLLAMILLATLVTPVVACTGCSGRFPAGVNLRLMKMRYQNDLDQRVFSPPPSKGQAIPVKAPATSTSASKTKAKPDAKKTKKSKAKRK